MKVHEASLSASFTLVAQPEMFPSLPLHRSAPR